MADPTMSQLAFDPTPSGPPQSFQPPAGAGSNPQWQQIMQAAQRGQISPEQFQQLAAKLGYSTQQGAPQAGPQAPPAAGSNPPQPQPQSTNPAINLGNAVGQLGGGLVKAGQSIAQRLSQPPNAAQGNPPPPQDALPPEARNQISYDTFQGMRPSPAWGN